MTPERLRVLDYVRESIARRGHAPSYGEIAQDLGYKSRGNVHLMVSSLVEEGLLLREPKGHRALSLPGIDLRAVPSILLRAELERREQADG